MDFWEVFSVISPILMAICVIVTVIEFLWSEHERKADIMRRFTRDNEKLQAEALDAYKQMIQEAYNAQKNEENTASKQ